jgi:hypothetical protein
MLARISLAICLLAGLTAWCQETAATSDASMATDDGSELQAPPPVSGQAYSTTFAGETGSNYLTGGISLSGGYSSNVVAVGTNLVGDASFSVWPTIALDKTTYRMHLVLDYAPGFTVYQHTTSLNQASQNVAMNLQYHFSPNLSVSLQEGFQRTSNIFDQANPLSATTVSGSAPTSTTAIVAPAASLMTNTTSAQFMYQIGADAMIGGGGNYSALYYPNSPQDAGVYNSRTAGGSLFYSTRFRERNYVGVDYQYQNSLSFQSAAPSVLTQTQTIFFFFTRYLNPNLSFSVSAGPQHFGAEQPGQVPAGAWQPMTMISMNWQGERTTVASSYARTVSGGGGLNGTFHYNSANMFATWRASRNWTTGVSGSYSNYQNLVPFFFLSNPGGHTLIGTASLQRTLNEHTNIQFGYGWAHQSYLGVPTISNNPNTNRAFVTLNFKFSRPLQR